MWNLHQDHIDISGKAKMRTSVLLQEAVFLQKKLLQIM
jgi:hypothetical protein